MCVQNHQGLCKHPHIYRKNRLKCACVYVCMYEASRGSAKPLLYKHYGKFLLGALHTYIHTYAFFSHFCYWQLHFLCHIFMQGDIVIRYFLVYWSFIEKNSVKQSMKCIVCSNFQMSFLHLSQMDHPVDKTLGQVDIFSQIFVQADLWSDVPQ